MTIARSRPSKPVLIAMLIAAALVVVTLVIVAAVVIPSGLRGAAVDSVDVVDISSEPHTAWTYDWIGDTAPEYLDDAPGIVAIGDDSALVWPVFDYAAYLDAEGGSGWYQGYDEHYEAGYAAGLEYRADDAAHDADTYPYTVPRAKEEHYFPEGAYGNFDEFLGFQDGFYDAARDEREGHSKKEKPADPDFVPKISLIDAVSGAQAWQVDLSEAIAGATFASSFSVYDVAESTAVAVIASTPRGEAIDYTLVTLAESDGRVLSSLTSDGPIDVTSFAGDVVVAVTNVDDAAATISRLPVDGLDTEPLWRAQLPGRPFLSVSGEFVVASGEDGGAVLTGSNGKRAGWGDDVSYAVRYEFIGDDLVRVETSEDGEEYLIDGWTTRGDAKWDTQVRAGSAWLIDGALFTAASSGDSYDDLQRIDPETGAALWASAYGQSFDAVLGVQGSAVILTRAGSLVVLDLSSGTAKLDQEVGDVADLFEGQSLYYVSAEQRLSAYRYSSRGVVWSLVLTDDESATVVGSRLALVNGDEGTLSGLAG